MILRPLQAPLVFLSVSAGAQWDRHSYQLYLPKEAKCGNKFQVMGIMLSFVAAARTKARPHKLFSRCSVFIPRLTSQGQRRQRREHLTNRSVTGAIVLDCCVRLDLSFYWPVQGTSALDGEVITGDYIGAVVGVRIATPFFGTGFNLCIGEIQFLLGTLEFDLHHLDPNMQVSDGV